MSYEVHEPLPPPRWKVRGGGGGCWRTGLFVLIGFIGLTGASCCVWMGLVHSLVEDQVEREGGWEALERRSEAARGRDAYGASEPARSQPSPTGNSPTVRRGLIPMDEVREQVNEEDTTRRQPEPTPVPPKRKRTDEGELFGF